MWTTQVNMSELGIKTSYSLVKKAEVGHSFLKPYSYISPTKEQRQATPTHIKNLLSHIVKQKISRTSDPSPCSRPSERGPSGGGEPLYRR